MGNKNIFKRFFVIFHGRFPSEKAASLFAAKDCESFADKGIKVTLLVPRRFGRAKSDPFEYYGVKNNFNVVYLPTIDVFPVPFLNKFAFHISFLVFSIFCFLYLLVKAKRGDVIYSNESLPLLISSLYFGNTFYELHDFPESKFWFFKLLFKRVCWILIHNKWKIQKFKEVFNLDTKKVIHKPNAVEIADFDISLSKDEARVKLGLPKDKFIIIYTGHLYGWKGVDALALSSEFLPENGLIIFIGGTEGDILSFKKKYARLNKISILGQKKHSEIPMWQKAADVLVIPNTAKEDISKYYTSPMKLFEYMVSKRPIVATDIPSITEILDKDNSILVEPDSPEKLAEGFLKVMDNRKLSEELSARAFRDVQKYSWQKRAEDIIGFMTNI